MCHQWMTQALAVVDRPTHCLVSSSASPGMIYPVGSDHSPQMVYHNHIHTRFHNKGRAGFVAVSATESSGSCWSRRFTSQSLVSNFVQRTFVLLSQFYYIFIGGRISTNLSTLQSFIAPHVLLQMQLRNVLLENWVFWFLQNTCYCKLSRIKGY